mmetsp:Transcript_52316/g.126517  ORF Transcript_52316/g.126517 Transcript_52316/m.126517 type:complete len:460 (-) Transcript_52316:174-1553(-)
MASPSPATNDGYGLLSSIKLVKEMVEKEFSQPGGNASSSAAGNSDQQSQPRGGGPGGPTDTVSEIYKLKQQHYEDSKNFKDQFQYQKDEIRRLEKRLGESQNENKIERELRATLEQTLEAQASHNQTLSSQLDQSQIARLELEERVKTLLETFKEQTGSLSKERASSEKLIKELQAQKREADSRTGAQEAGRLRAEKQRDELQAKVASLQKHLDDERSKAEKIQIERGNNNQSSASSGGLHGGSAAYSSSSGLTWTSALKALDILKKEKNHLKAELGRVKSEQRQKLEDLEKSNKELQRQLDLNSKSLTIQTTGDKASSLSSGTSSKKRLQNHGNQSQQTQGDGMPSTSTSPSFQTAISKASTLVASLQSSVEEIEKAVDVNEGGDDKNQKATNTNTKPQQSSLKPTKPSGGGTRSSKTTGITAATAGGKRPNTPSTATTGGGGTGKKVAKKQKTASKK